ncbi:hypothetical protein VDGE_06547 [Verticillium dahliae]|uniref:SNF2 family ATP-dependent chromatin-remodeling factor snf21 n=1 Tax=Verticillium dahliae TaxID=27337 RepID=A0A444S2R0_VERDA|nr:hypothetical protein VDGE_06547 [Verticillium dahliae]
MASVQVPPAVQHPGAGGMPTGPTQQQAQEVFMKLKAMKERGVPANDPDYIKAQQFLYNFQQQAQMRQKQQAWLAQQQQAQAQAKAANGAVNGAQPQNLQQPTPQPTQQGLSAGIGAPKGPTNATASSPSTQVAPSHFTTQQLALLRQQISVFKLLGKNQGVPEPMQQAIFAQRERRRVIAAEAVAATSQALDAADAKGADGAAGKKPMKEPTFKTVLSPFEPEGPVPKPISYFNHMKGENRILLPAILPTGVDVDQLRRDREMSINNRIRDRYHELRKLPANFAHWNVNSGELTQPDDSARIKAIIEMKSLGLYKKQCLLRDRIGKSMMAYDNLAMTTNRSNYRRMKKMTVREARITEKLEKQQRDARESREKKRHVDFLQAVSQRRNEMMQTTNGQRNKSNRLARLMNTQHTNIEKEEQKRIERTAKQRLQALKANDEEAYLKLLDQAKDTRITHLLRQTDGFLRQLAASVKSQQRKAAAGYDEEEEEEMPMEDDSEADSDEEEKAKKIDYYAVAHRVKEDVTEQASILVGGKLKEYQLKGLQWMLSLYNNNLNGILADEMGLGKTIQTISLVTYLIERKLQDGPYLVIVPLSTLTNWTLEFEKWAPSVTKIVYKGPPNARKQQQDKIRQGRFQVLLTTYEYIIKDRPILSKIKWFHMIIDEGHRMKNQNSKLTATIQQYYHTRFRLILTGTPLQNNLTELWAMLNFVLPNIFKSVKTFDEWFNTPFANTGGQDKMDLTEEEQILVIRRLHKVLRPFLLRRLKKDVEKDLPDKTEKVIKCKFSALQTKLYKQMVTHNKIVVSDGQGGKTGARGLSNMIMQLRKLCNHPFVFGEVENVMNPLNISDDKLWRTAGKFELLDRILPKYKATGHRVLMFFQMTAIMDIMEDYLRYRNFQYMRLDGTTKSDERSDLLKDFNAPDSPYFMFLLSTRAGGLGLNLQTADTVIIYDSDWNPHQDLQAQDRAHRIGQKNEVRILRLISSNSVEEKILERARFKLDMDGKVIQAGRFDNKSTETDRDAMLRTLLESADLADSGDQEEMDDDELNMMLARNDDEVAVFQKMDEERRKDVTNIYVDGPHKKGKPRLLTDEELPDIYLGDGNPVQEEEETVLGRGARERTKVKYDDGLTEEQWLMAVDDDDDSPEAAAARKQGRKERREANRLKREAGVQVDDSPTASRASSEEIETPKKRGRKPVVKAVEKRKADDGDDEPPAKKRRGPTGRGKAVSSGANSVLAQQRGQLNKSLRSLFDGLMTLEVDDPEPVPPEDDESDPGKRIIIGPFLVLPPKRDFPDYYILITQPISMKQIKTKIKKEKYNSLGDLKTDVDLMFSNCQTYNEEASLLYQDAQTLQNFFHAEMAKELEKHPGLKELEADTGSKEQSVAPSTGAATPQTSASGPTRIKLISSSSAAAAKESAPASANGGGSDAE